MITHTFKNRINTIIIGISFVLSLSTPVMAQEQKIEHQPQLFIGGIDINNPDNLKQYAEDLNRILNPNKLSENGADKGIGRLFLGSLLGIDSDYPIDFTGLIEVLGKAPDVDLLLATKGDERCKAAKEEKVEFHTKDGAVLPISFGKITAMDLVEYENPKWSGSRWAGSLDLCSWIRNSVGEYDEHFIHMDFAGHLPSTVVLSKRTENPNKPFPGTLDMTEVVDPTEMLALMNKFDFKLHGKSPAVKISAIWENGQFIPIGSPEYIVDNDCFDFFAEKESDVEILRKGALPDQMSYCMGRCDGLVMNTR